MSFNIIPEKQRRTFFKILLGGILFSILLAVLVYSYYWAITSGDFNNPDIAKATDAADAMGVILLICVLLIYPLALPVGFFVSTRLFKSKSHFWLSLIFAIICAGLFSSIFLFMNLFLFVSPILSTVIVSTPYYLILKKN